MIPYPLAAIAAVTALSFAAIAVSDATRAAAAAEVSLLDFPLVNSFAAFAVYLAAIAVVNAILVTVFTAGNVCYRWLFLNAKCFCC